jgi:predicted metalloprotease
VRFLRAPAVAAAVAVAAALVAGCTTTSQSVTAVRADQLNAPPSTSPPFQEVPGEVLTPPVDATDEPAPGSSAPGTPPSTAPTDEDPAEETAGTPPATTAPSATIDPEAIDFGLGKPVQPHDDYLLATISDLGVWWSQEYPAIYGEAFSPITAVYAAYPDRPDDIPGCGTPRTTYREVNEYAAFYCGVGDFMVYDDGPTGLLQNLAGQFGPASVAIVLAHEYGHAIQQRAGLLDRGLATIVSEQQADCFAGAWAARARTGAVAGIVFTEDDVKTGLISMLEVSDPLGIDQFSPGGHGSGFDRVGAFQEGFTSGAARCAELVDEPLELVPNQFLNDQDYLDEGNAPWGYDGAALLGFLPLDLNLYWGSDVADIVPEFDELTLVPVTSIDDVTCGSLSDGFEDGAALCSDTDTVFLNEPAALQLYQQPTFGDFSVGYLIGIEWAEAVQLALGSPLGGEARALANDCLTGAWVNTVMLTDDGVLPQPRNPERESAVSPGDLDEAVHTAIQISDPSASDDVIGGAFEKIAAFRVGVLGGLDPCLAQL